MVELIDQPHCGELIRPTNVVTTNRIGRPRKFVRELRESGYSFSDVNDCIQVLFLWCRSSFLLYMIMPGDNTGNELFNR